MARFFAVAALACLLPLAFAAPVENDDATAAEFVGDLASKMKEELADKLKHKADTGKDLAAEAAAKLKEEVEKVVAEPEPEGFVTKTNIPGGVKIVKKIFLPNGIKTITTLKYADRVVVTETLQVFTTVVKTHTDKIAQPTTTTTTTTTQAPAPAVKVFGDPHFVVDVPGLDTPVCFEQEGHGGDAFTMIKDEEKDLTINFELGEVKRAHHEHRLFIFKVAIMLGDVTVAVNRHNIKVGSEVINWGEATTKTVAGARVHMNKRGSLMFNMENGIVVIVERRTRANAEDYLNVEIENEHLLSEGTTGVVGQWVHKHVSATTPVHVQGRHYKQTTLTSAGKSAHAYLMARADPFVKGNEQCLAVHQADLVHLMGHQDNKVEGLFSA